MSDAGTPGKQALLRARAVLMERNYEVDRQLRERTCKESDREALELDVRELDTVANWLAQVATHGPC